MLPLHSVQGGRCSCEDPTCSSPGKHPLTRHGVKDGTTDPNQINGWWAEWPTANVGIATGKVSGLLIIDLDRKDDPKEDGLESLKFLRKNSGRYPGHPRCRRVVADTICTFGCLSRVSVTRQALLGQALISEGLAGISWPRQVAMRQATNIVGMSTSTLH